MTVGRVAGVLRAGVRISSLLSESTRTGLPSRRPFFGALLVWLSQVLLVWRHFRSCRTLGSGGLCEALAGTGRFRLCCVPRAGQGRAGSAAGPLQAPRATGSRGGFWRASVWGSWGTLPCSKMLWDEMPCHHLPLQCSGELLRSRTVAPAFPFCGTAP